ncbi:hypothetical protein [Salipaludibacillus keqinensis]|nr:hypothetical protein [Salipaludibacillus keqinensis]
MTKFTEKVQNPDGLISFFNRFMDVDIDGTMNYQYQVTDEGETL